MKGFNFYNMCVYFKQRFLKNQKVEPKVKSRPQLVIKGDSKTYLAETVIPVLELKSRLIEESLNLARQQLNECTSPTVH